MRTGAAAGLGHSHARHHRQEVSGADDDPPRVFAFGLVQHYVRDGAVAQENQNEGSHELAEQLFVHLFLTSAASKTGCATYTLRSLVTRPISTHSATKMLPA